MSPIPPAPRPTSTACVCAMVGGLIRLALAVAAVLGLVAGAAEVGLRAAGVEPRVPIELSNVVPDGWTGFRLRPGVSGPEPYVTNDLGMHAPRSYELGHRRGGLRVAVLGSSVVYGLNVPFAETIPMAIERELQAVGHRAEVLNFGTNGFSIVNLSALLQAYVHQFQPDVVVVVVDLQIGLPRWPAVHPSAAPDEAIEKLGWWEGLRKRGSGKSAVLTLLDDPRRARRWIRRATGLPLRPRQHPPPGQPEARAAPVPTSVPLPRARPRRRPRRSAPTRRSASASWRRRWPRWPPSPPRSPSPSTS